MDAPAASRSPQKKRFSFTIQLFRLLGQCIRKEKIRQNERKEARQIKREFDQIQNSPNFFHSTFLFERLYILWDDGSYTTHTTTINNHHKPMLLQTRTKDFFQDRMQRYQKGRVFLSVCALFCVREILRKRQIDILMYRQKDRQIDKERNRETKKERERQRERERERENGRNKESSEPIISFIFLYWTPWNNSKLKIN